MVGHKLGKYAADIVYSLLRSAGEIMKECFLGTMNFLPLCHMSKVLSSL